MENNNEESQLNDDLIEKLKNSETALQMVKQLRKEAAERRIENKSLNEKLASLNEKEQELASVKQKLAELESTVVPKAQQLESYLQERRDAVKEKLGAKWKESFASLPLSDLDALAAELGGAVPASDRSNNYGSRHSIIKTAEEKIASIYKR